MQCEVISIHVPTDIYEGMNFILLLFALQIIESKKHLRIIGGRDAAENEYPYVARIEILELRNGKIIERSHVCTSTILTPDWTLTAAHCVDMDIFDITRNRKRSSVQKGVIWYGHVRAAATKDAYSDILDVVKHPATIIEYFEHQPLNDIALIRTQPIKIKEYGKLSTLDAQSLIGLEVDVVGYGYTNSSNGNIDDTLVLQKPLQVLKAIIKSCGEVEIVMYPTLGLASSCGVWSSVLPGDSGGPVIHLSGVVAINTLIDDVDLSRETDRPFSVGYVTPTSPFIDWMSSLMTKTIKY